MSTENPPSSQTTSDDPFDIAFLKSSKSTVKSNLHALKNIGSRLGEIINEVEVAERKIVESNSISPKP